MTLWLQGESPFRFCLNPGYQPLPRDLARPFDTACLTAVATSLRREMTGHLGPYEPSPLVSLPATANRLGIEQLWMKDEGSRFTNNASPESLARLMKSFKPLGAFAAITPLLAEGGPVWQLWQQQGGKHHPFGRFLHQEVVLASATDGNHGLGLAFVASLRGIRCRIYVPKQTTAQRIDAIQALGANVVVSDGNYDRSVEQCRRETAAHDTWFEVSDVSTPEYQEIPIHIMQGYTLIIQEFLEQIARQRQPPPTVVFLQAGVGTMAGALTAALRTLLPSDQQPRIVVCEPVRAAGILHYMTEGGEDISRLDYKGDLATKAAGLSCGTPAYVGFEILRRQADAFLTVPEPLIDLAAALVYRESWLTNPAHPLFSGESGAFGLAALLAARLVPGLAPLRNAVGLNRRDARVLTVSTEADTDAGFAQTILEGYREPLGLSYRTHFADLELLAREMNV